ncbi:uncharacterized protein I206_104788 [Kwoniella pini CBS 10737]|uniref:DUF6534 domain-containing protein n=1 Tax=Kwoniella pini CBS 10737 TaxID=1296096 RepID=A0AAJ8MQL4_9TREE
MSVIDITGMPVEQVEAIAKMAFGDDVGWHIGPFLLSVIFDGILLGVISQQYMTWWTYSRLTERKINVYVTHFLVTAAVAYTACEISYALHNFVYNFGKFRVFLEIRYPQVFPILGWITSAPIQLFYTERTFRLNGNNWLLCILLMGLILGTFGMTVWVLVFCQTLSSELQALLIVRQVQAWQCLTLATDSIITISIAWGLYRSRTGWSKTDALVKRLMIITLETQLGPTILMLAFVIEFAISPPTTLGIFFEQLIPKFYLVGFLATLNSRYNLRRDSQPELNAQCSPKTETRLNTYLLGSGQMQQATVNIETGTYFETHHMQKSQIGLNRLPLQDNSQSGNQEDLDEKFIWSNTQSTHSLHDVAELM